MKGEAVGKDEAETPEKVYKASRNQRAAMSTQFLMNPCRWKGIRIRLD